MDMYKNISSHIKDLELKTKYYNDNKNAWYYILFVILVFAGSFTGLMLNYFRKEERTKELEVLYKDFVERDNLEKGNQFEDPALKNSCKDLIKSVNSLVGVGLTAGEEDSVGDLSQALYRSHSSSLHSNSYISLLCRRMSLGKSSITLSERYDSISESCEEQDSHLNRKNRKPQHFPASRRPSIKFLNERRNTKSTYSLERQKKDTDSNETESTAMLENPEAVFPAASLNNINSLILPSITRKPSITFSETVSIIKTERRNSSPSISSSLASDVEKNDILLGNKSLSEEQLSSNMEGLDAGENKTKISTSLCSLLDRSGLFEDFNQYLSRGENNLSPEDIPRIRRRQSIDVSKIDSNVPGDCDEDQTLLMPSIKITHHCQPHQTP